MTKLKIDWKKKKKKKVKLDCYYAAQDGITKWRFRLPIL